MCALTTEKCVMSIISGFTTVTFPVDPQPPMVDHTAQLRRWSKRSCQYLPIDHCVRSIPGRGFA